MRYATVGWLAWLALLSAAVGADAGTIIQPDLARPIQLRIEGYVGEKPAGLVPEVTWIVSCRGKTYTFHVSHLLVLTGDVSTANIMAAVEPYRTNFYLRGDEPALQVFAVAAPGEKIAMIAFLRGSRQLLIGRIGPVDVRTPTP